ncbi:MAG TPA: MarR family transcriptional regulator [Thermoanaerobaculia bacterium]|nr:MarR family transcriptional regulator [Thermoanaerobaculia bacterium]
MNGSQTTAAPAAMAFQVLEAAREVEARLESALGGVGLSLAKFGVLARLMEAGEPLPLGSLAERCSCVRSNMTQLMDRLEADRLVERVQEPRDRRSVLAALTKAGRERYAEAARILDTADQDLFASLGEVERTALKLLLQRFGKTG